MLLPKSIYENDITWRMKLSRILLFFINVLSKYNIYISPTSELVNIFELVDQLPHSNELMKIKKFLIDCLNLDHQYCGTIFSCTELFDYEKVLDAFDKIFKFDILYDTDI